jgi:hypothetical protein
MHRLLKLLVVIAVIAVLGPPALAFMAVLFGGTIALLAVALKVGVIVFGVFLAVTVLKAIFGTSQPRSMPRPIPTRDSPVDDAFDEMKRREDAQMAALDRELAHATRSL